MSRRPRIAVSPTQGAERLLGANRVHWREWPPTTKPSVLGTHRDLPALREGQVTNASVSAIGVQLFTTDPGRALISGDWAYYEGFDVPQLRGIPKTAPYFHDHSQADLPTMITTYS